MNNKINMKYRPSSKIGLGGVAIGNGFAEHNDQDCLAVMEAAWAAGVRYFDTSPWYGLGISEHRMGIFLKDKARDQYDLSTKVGRILEPHEDFKKDGLMWKGKMNFTYRYDYTAEGTRRSVEDSLQRMGLSSIDMVFIHDLSEDNPDLGKNWEHYFEIAQTGAMPELIKMREEGIIKGWGLGVNTIEPIIKTMEVSDPDIFLSACQYSLIKHEDDLHQVFPEAAKNGISIVVGAPLCAGFLAGQDRYLYNGDFPAGVKEKLAALTTIAEEYDVDLRTAALQFAAAPDVVSAVIPGASSANQVEANTSSYYINIPGEFWDKLKREKLIDENAPTPKKK